MHAVIVQVTIKDREASEGFLKEQLVPGVAQAPGFVTGHWVNIGGDRGISMIVFESEEAATGFAESEIRPPEEVVTIESIQVGEVVANA